MLLLIASIFAKVQVREFTAKRGHRIIQPTLSKKLFRVQGSSLVTPGPIENKNVDNVSESAMLWMMHCTLHAFS
jgi:hypothetical protein